MKTTPTIFLSYSWTNLAHEQWVVGLAERLISDGIDIKLDKWDLKEGHDKFTFMESMVLSPDISKVLMICDKMYTDKANGKLGGVGTETQIISPEIYGNVEQQKFIPIVAERDENGNEYLPTFLKSRIYIDLTSDNFESEYEKLLRNIYGRPAYSKPKLGKAPSYLFEDKISTFNTSKFVKSFEVQIEKYPKRINSISRDFFHEYFESLKVFSIGNNSKSYDETCKLILDNLHNYDNLKNDYVDFITKLSKETDEFDVDILIDFLEKLLTLQYPLDDRGSYISTEFDMFRIIIQELFILTIAIILKSGNYKLLEEIIYSSYYLNSKWDKQKPNNYNSFYSYVTYLDDYYTKIYSKQFASVMADILIKRLPKEIGIDDFVKADIFLCYIGQINKIDWFPITYIYGKMHSIDLFYKLTSRRYFEKVKGLFNVSTPEELSATLNELKSKDNDRNEYSYRGFYNRLPRVFEAIDIANLASLR